MDKVEIFCFRSGGWSGYYGFGLSPEMAIRAAQSAGMLKKEIPKGKLIRLPEGIVEYGVDGMGGVNWLGAADGAKPTYYEYDKKSKTFIEKKEEE